MTAPPRTLIVLGSGGSIGVPVIGCDCRVCTSTDPKDARTRPSVLLQLPAGNLLIDTSPELRIQLVREKIGLVHAVVYTHYHVDHLFGLDDVRVFPKKLGHPLPIHCTDEVEDVIRHVFSYAFHPPADLPSPFVLPQLRFHRIDETPFELLGLTLTPVPLIHGRFNVLGFRVGDLAYCTDVSEIPARSWPLLQGLDTLILDAVNTPDSVNAEAVKLKVRKFATLGDLLMNLDTDLCRKLVNTVLPGLSLLDPACGSGAFLVAAMKTLINIYSAVIGRIKFLSDRNLTAWLRKIEKEHPSIGYYIKKRIITDNLYGVDIMEEATEIARLRLFLALVASASQVEHLEPLPNIDFNVLPGNSLIGLMRVDDADFEKRNAQGNLFFQCFLLCFCR